MKLVLKLFGGLILILVIALVAIWFYMGSIIKEAVERIGPEVTGTNVQLDSAKLSLLDGSGSLNGFVLGNPEGFSYPNAFTLGAIDMQLDPKSLTSDVIVIKNLSIDAPKITYENGAAGDNFKALQKNIQDKFGASEAETEDSGSAKKVIIERFSLLDGDITVSHTQLSNDLNVPMPDLVLTDIGRATNGATVAEASKQILEQVTRAATKAVAESALADELNRRVDEFKEEAEQKVKDKIAEELGDPEQLDDVKDKLKKLF